MSWGNGNYWDKELGISGWKDISKHRARFQIISVSRGINSRPSISLIFFYTMKIFYWMINEWPLYSSKVSDVRNSISEPCHKTWVKWHPHRFEHITGSEKPKLITVSNKEYKSRTTLSLESLCLNQSSLKKAGTSLNCFLLICIITWYKAGMSAQLTLIGKA